MKNKIPPRKVGDKLLAEKTLLIKFFIIPADVLFFDHCFRCNFAKNRSSL